MHARRQMHHGLLSAELLRPNGKQRSAHQLDRQLETRRVNGAEIRNIRCRRTSADQTNGLCQRLFHVRTRLKTLIPLSLAYSLTITTFLLLFIYGYMIYLMRICCLPPYYS